MVAAEQTAPRRNRWLTGLILAAVGWLPWPAPAASGEPTWYVAPAGDDAWSGRLAAPNAQRTDGPFATLERARDAVRQARATGPLPAGGATVTIRGGRYPLTRALQLDAQDSGTATAPVTWRAYPGEQPVLLGGRDISGFTVHQGRVLKADLAAQGLRQLASRQLLYKGRRQPLARYPNQDPRQPITGGWAYVDGQPIPMYSEQPNDTRTQLTVKPGDARRWSHPEDGEVFIFARYNWWNNLTRIKSYDSAARTITLAANTSYAIRPTDRYFVQGLFEELDAPGEWYLDARSATLYFQPPDEVAPRDVSVTVPTLQTIWQLGPGCQHVTVRGLTIEGCDGDAVVLRDCADCRVAGNTVRNVGYYAGNGIRVIGGYRNTVVGNDLHDVGHDAIVINGGNRLTLTPGESAADNNYIHHPGIYYKWGCGIRLEGCGVRATHNLIHDCPRAAIAFMGNNLLMEYNHLRHLCLESEDASGVGTGGRDWISSRGSVVRHNLIHDVLGFGRSKGRWVSPFFAWGIYLDDNTGGVDVIGNIVARCGRAGLHLHNARDIVVDNNVFVDNRSYQIELSGWTTKSGPWTRHFPTMVKGYEAVAGQPAWQAMRGMKLHPKDAPLPNGTIMAGNVFERNIVTARDPAARLYRVRNVDYEHNRWDHNLLWQGGQPAQVEGLGALAPAALWPAWLATGEDPNSLVADPRFVAAANDDFRLRPDSPARRLGFKDIPVEQIGPYASEWRATWPVVQAEGAREHPLVTADRSQP